MQHGDSSRRISRQNSSVCFQQTFAKLAKQIPINQIRKRLAKKHKATIGCPITTGIFAWIAAQAAEEDKEEGRNIITPYWRTVKEKGEINPKYPGGAKALKNILEKEGHKIIKKGKRYFVKDFERFLVR